MVTDGSQVLKYTAATAGGVIALVKDTAWAGVTTGNYYVEARIKPQSNSTTGSRSSPATSIRSRPRSCRSACSTPATPTT